MYCTYILTIASMKMFLRNRQALFFSLFMPLIILFIFGSIDFDNPGRMQIGLVTHSPTIPTAQFVKQIRSVKTLSIHVGTLDSELAELSSGNRTAVIDVPDDLLSHINSPQPRQLSVYVNAGRPLEAQIALAFLNQLADHVSLVVAGAPVLFTIKQQSVTAHNFRYIEFLLPGVIAMAVMQMSVFSVAFVFTRYKEQGILKRLLATPMRPTEFVIANIITRLFMAVAQSSLFIALGIAGFHIHIAGSFWLLALCVILGGLMFLGLGFTISGLSKTIETAPLLANIVVFPMLFMGNVFFSVSNMPPWLRTFASYLPLTFFASAMRGVMTNGAGPSEIHRELIGMFVWATILIALAIFSFRFQEKDST
jgi:ABC-2 type transport system permease protein